MAINELTAILVADDLIEFLQSHPDHLASVHSVFPNAVNLLISEDALLTLTRQDDITPMGLITDGSLSFVQFLKTGDDVLLYPDQFKAENGAFTLHLHEPNIWESGSLMNLVPYPSDDLAEINHQLIHWLRAQPAMGLLPLLPRLTHQSLDVNPIEDNLFTRYIASDLEGFKTAIDKSDWGLALDLTDRLIGFGMGSTPSCDDFLAAYLMVFKIAKAVNPGTCAWVGQFNQAVAEKAKKRTTLISANMLMHAANGKISRSHQLLLQSCFLNKKDDLVLSASRVLQHGATSGGDFLLGFVCALEWYRNSTLDHQKEGEQARVG